MVIALLAVLGVDLIVIVAFVLAVSAGSIGNPTSFAASSGSAAVRSTVFARNGAGVMDAGCATS